MPHALQYRRFHRWLKTTLRSIFVKLLHRAERAITVALLLSLNATLSQFALAQTIAPEPDPFTTDPFLSSNTKHQRPATTVEFGNKPSTLNSSKPNTSSAVLTPLRVLQLGESKIGGPIASIPSDPYMTAEQEARILAALHTHDDTDWDGISIIELKRVLKNRLPIWINRTELGIVGTDVNAALETSGDVVAGPLGDRLKCLFNDMQVGFAIRANRLEISSLEDLDSLSNTRIYDVTPLVLRTRAGKRVFDFEKLGRLIQLTIDPDSWINAGGTNVISDFIVGEPGSERSLIVVSAPTSVHLQLQPLLDRLNIAPPKFP